MLTSVLVGFVLLSFLGTSVRADLDSDYTNSAYLDEAKTYKLYWKIDNDKKSIQFAARVKTLGWIGFGISSGSGNMVGSDVVIGWVKDNKGYLKVILIDPHGSACLNYDGSSPSDLPIEIITRASVGTHESKNAGRSSSSSSYLVAKMMVMVPGVPS